MKQILNLLLISIIIITLSSYIFSQNTGNTLYGYNEVNLDHWSCDLGRRQSPINLRDNNSTYSNEFNIVYDHYKSFEDIFVTFRNNQLQIVDKQVLLNPNSSTDMGYLVLSYKGFYFKFNLEKITINVPSEHLINGVPSDLEIHFTHKKDLDYVNTANEFKRRPDISQNLVISILYSVSGTESDNNFLDLLTSHYRVGGTVNTFGLSFDIIESGLIRDKKFYFYSGSDNISPCDETHLHYVVADEYKLNQQSLDFYRDRYEAQFDGTKSSFSKPISELFGRNVTRNFYNDTLEFAESSSFMSLSWMMIFGLFVLLV